MESSVRCSTGAGPERGLPAGRCNTRGPQDAAQCALDLHHGAIGAGDGQLHDLGGTQQPEAYRPLDPLYPEAHGP